MSSYKDKLKLLKDPDIFQRVGYQLLDNFAKRRALYLGGLFTVVVVIVGLFVAAHVRDNLREDRRNEVAAIDRVYETQEELANDKRQELYKELTRLKAELAKYETAQKKKEATKTKGKKKKSGDKEIKDLDPSVTKETLAKLESDLKGVKSDHSKSLSQYLEFAKANDDNPEGWNAALRAAKIYEAQQKYLELVDLLAPVLDKTSDISFYSIQVRLYYAGVLEHLERHDEALSVLQQIKEDQDQTLWVRVLLARGRVLGLSGSKEEAAQVLNDLIQRYPNSTEAHKARAMKLMW